ncbi:MAG: UDP-3-O-(3-hydroxymyristoyl)glucosamine N-acyltransferase [Alphaproteobacteria bacterium GM202ARS2]|nr:UDP-3-O-(3-hydroxymyristoyl)glucosamine N-acyltransferase [Alphaproteobacteria bacterium GM202ARS2]
MADERLFHNHGPLPLGEIAERVGARLAESSHGARVISSLSSLESATEDDISFFDNKKYLSAFQASRAGACIVQESVVSSAPAGMALLLSAMPYLTYARVGRLFYSEVTAGGQGGKNVHESAVVAPGAQLGKGCSLAAGVVIENGAQIGEGCVIGAHSVIGAHCTLGRDCILGSHVSLSHAVVGERVHIHAGARIGQEGFGFAPDGQGGFETVLQLGRVVVGNDVVIGANTTIDRGSLQDTVIGAHCRIDNLVHIAHNVVLGRGCILAGQVGISGSTRFGDYCMIGGQVGFSGHSKVGSKVSIAAKSGVMRDIADGEKVAGIPAVPVRQWHKQTLVLGKLAGRHSGHKLAQVKKET